MKKLIAFAFLFMAVLPLAMLAVQDVPPTPVVIDPLVVAAVLYALVGGVGVVGITQTLKVLLKLTGVAAYILTAVVSLGGTVAYFLLMLHEPFGANVFKIILYSVIVFGEASGLYKVIQVPTPPASSK